MKRIAFKLLLFLLQGAIINVAVAWEFLWYNRTDKQIIETEVQLMTLHLFVDVPRQMNKGSLTIEELALPGMYVEYAWPYLHADGSVTNAVSTDIYLGWPMYACSGRLDGSDFWVQSKSRVLAHHLNVFPRLSTPHFPGFAVNTVLYAAAMSTLWAVLGSFRRWRRVRRGLCPTCSYPVGASKKCSECGAMVRPIA